VTPTARRVLIFAAAAALGGEVVLALWVAAAFYGFVAFGNGVHLGAAGPGLLEVVAVVLNVGMAAVFALGALILLLAGFGVVLNKPMQAVMIGVSALQLFMTIVVTGLTGWMQFGILGGTFVLLCGALAVTMVTGEPPAPEPGPVEPAPSPAKTQPPSNGGPTPAPSAG
jgi:hypothetical protein